MEENEDMIQPGKQEVTPPAAPEVVPVQPVQPPAAPAKSRWTPLPQPPAVIYATGKRELLFGLAVLAGSLFLMNSIGYGFDLGFAIGAISVMACSVGYLLSTGCRLDWYTGSLMALAAITAAGFGRSADGFVKYVLGHFILLAGNLALCIMAGQNRRETGGIRSLLDAPRALFRLGFGGMGAASRGLREARKNAGAFGRKSTAVAAGLAVAVPVAAVMIMLLTQADAAFEGMLKLLPEVEWGELIMTLLMGVPVGWLLYTRGVALRHSEKKPAKQSRIRGFSHLTINTVLIAVCAVYGAYLVSQLAYLSGGLSGILPEEFTMAEYARRGFFEMALLCGINLTVIACGVGLLEKREKVPLVTRLLSLFIGLVTVFLVVTASAKMFMYIGGYGLTRLRVLTEVIMVWLGLTTVIVCLWLFVPKMPYIKIVLLLALAMGAGVIWTDVDTQVARYNVSAYQLRTLKSIDVTHLTRLGPGAVPYILKLTEDDDPEVAKQAQAYLDFLDCSVEDFREWNLAKVQAEVALEAMRVEESRVAAAYLTEVLGVQVPEGKVQKRRYLRNLEEKGQTYLALELTEQQAEAFLPRLEEAARENGSWHFFSREDTAQLPSDSRFPDFTTDRTPQISILPEPEEGYLFFLDRHPEAEDRYDLCSFLERKTFYFSMAIYDPQTRTLYFVTMDTPDEP